MTRIGGVYGATKSGLQARWGSDLDFQIARSPQPKTALPSDVRSKLGLKKRSVEGRTSILVDANKTLLSKTPKTPKNRNASNYRIEKRSFLRKGSGKTPNAKNTLTLRRQTIA